MGDWTGLFAGCRGTPGVRARAHAACAVTHAGVKAITMANQSQNLGNRILGPSFDLEVVATESSVGSTGRGPHCIVGMSQIKAIGVPIMRIF